MKENTEMEQESKRNVFIIFSFSFYFMKIRNVLIYTESTNYDLWRAAFLTSPTERHEFPAAFARR